MDVLDSLEQILQKDKGVITKIDVLEKNIAVELVIFFQSGKEQFSTVNNKNYSYYLSSNAIDILKSIVNEQQTVLIESAYGYYDSGRTYLIFLYDLVMLCWCLDKLGSNFQSLKNVTNGERELLHNRIVLQTSIQLNKKFNNLEFEKGLNGRYPDLFANNYYFEIKTVNTPVLSQEDYKLFFKNFERQFKHGQGQISNKGIIFMGFWSKRVNNELLEYFPNLVKTNFDELKNNHTILVLEGNKPLCDYYVQIPTSNVLELISDYCTGGHKRLPSMTYGNDMMRQGFPYSVRGNDPSHISFSFKMS